MSLMKLDLTKHTSKFAAAFVTMGLYNTFVTKLKLSKGNLYDSASFGLSNIFSGLASDVILDLLNQNDGILPYLSEPVLNSFIYPYLYNTFAKNTLFYEGQSYVRSDNTNMLLGAVGSLITKYLQNPLMGLWGFKSY